MQLFNSGSPSVVVEFEARNHLDKSFSYDEKEEKVVDGKLVKIRTGNRREVKRHVVQCIGTDANGDEFFCFALPVRDYVPDFSRFQRGPHRFAVTRLESDDNGALLVWFCGFEPIV